MTAQEYLAQAYRLDQRINSKIEQLGSLNNLATKCTAVMNGMPRSSNGGNSSTADVIIKIISLQDEINQDIDRLVDLKKEIIEVIKSVPDPKLRIILEMRYLCYKTWEEIADELRYSNKWVRLKHEEALKAIYTEISKRFPKVP